MHRSHKHIADQALFLDAYFIKLQQNEKKISCLFANTKLIDHQSVGLEMENNLYAYAEEEKKNV